MYRADGMRIKKVTGLSIAWNPPEGDAGGFYNEEQADDNPTWRYRYDGQMCYEEDFTRDDPVVVTGTSYALGARGIDMMRTFTVNQSTYERTYDTNGKSFPIYDGHGNMIATLGRSSSSPYYSIGNERQYDVWGGVRSGSTSGDPNNRYCANLGHKQDDESDLIYMLARYYEPGTGRFVSEDPDGDGVNWFVYARNDPTNGIDRSGKSVEGFAQLQWLVIGLAFFTFSLIAYQRDSVRLGIALAFAGCSAAYNAIGWNPRTPAWFKLACQNLNFTSACLGLASLLWVTSKSKFATALGLTACLYLSVLIGCLIDCYILPGEELVIYE